MTVAVVVLLAGLCLLDGALVGYRAVCGRSALIRRQALDRRGVEAGIRAGAAVLTVLTAWFGGVLLLADDRLGTMADLTRSATRMLVVYLALAAVTACALAVHFLAPPRWGSLSMVTVLGPLTLLRPLVLVLGAMSALSGAGDRRAIVLASVTVMLMVVTVESVLLDRWGDRVVPADRMVR